MSAPVYFCLAVLGALLVGLAWREDPSPSWRWFVAALTLSVVVLPVAIVVIQ